MAVSGVSSVFSSLTTQNVKKKPSFDLNSGAHLAQGSMSIGDRLRSGNVTA